MTMLKKLWSEERGQGMTEYGLILALIAVVCIGGLVAMGPAIKDKFMAIGDAVKTDPTATPTTP